MVKLCHYPTEEPETTKMKTYSTALITGASSGIGEAFARLLAAQGTDLILVARSADKLYRLSEELAEKHGIRADVIVADLSAAEAVRQVHEEVTGRGLSVDLLVNNAGFGSYGFFGELPLERESQEITLNIIALVELTHLFLPEMLAKRFGAVVNVASTAAFQPLPYMAVYAATKAFVLSFSEALWAECRSHGVRVLAFCPGPVDTGFAAAAGFADVSGPKFTSNTATAASVAAAAIAALAQDRSYVVPGRENYWLSVSSRFAPRALVAQMVERKMRPSESAPAPIITGSSEAQSLVVADRSLVSITSTASRDAGALAVGAAAIGALAVATVAVGAVAIGSMAIKRLIIGRSRVRSLEIDELVIRQLIVTEQVLPAEAE
jgi:short-subunit dehydrogenase